MPLCVGGRRRYFLLSSGVFKSSFLWCVCWQPSLCSSFVFNLSWCRIISKNKETLSGLDSFLSLFLSLFVFHFFNLITGLNIVSAALTLDRKKWDETLEMSFLMIQTSTNKQFHLIFSHIFKIFVFSWVKQFWLCVFCTFSLYFESLFIYIQ